MSRSSRAASNVGYHATIVKEMATLRGLISAGEDVARLGWERPGEVADLVDRAEQAFSSSPSSASRATSPTSRSCSRRASTDHAPLRVGRRGHRRRLGFREIDKLTSGFQPGNLIILAARPSMGKSALALCMAANLAVRQQKPVALFTLEMSKWK